MATYRFTGPDASIRRFATGATPGRAVGVTVAYVFDPSGVQEADTASAEEVAWGGFAPFAEGGERVCWVAGD